MKKILLGTLLFFSIFANAYEKKGDTFVLTKEEAAVCQKVECVLVPIPKIQMVINMAMQSAYEQGVADSQKKLQEAYELGFTAGVKSVNSGRI